MTRDDKKLSLWLVLLIGLVAGALGGGLVGGAAALSVERGYEPPLLAFFFPTVTPTATLVPSATPTATPSATPTMTPLPTATPTASPTPRPALADLITLVGPSVVTVAVAEAAGQEPQGFGSGVALLEPGIIVTNHHVVEDAARILVITADEREAEATLVGSDFFSDIAVLRVEEALALEPLRLATEQTPRVGEPVFAIGSALGDFRNSVTSGIVSGLGRMVLVDEAGFAYESLIQTDAAINRGNSGGPLLDGEGNVIGINTLIVRGSLELGEVEGLGFAIPASVVAQTARTLLADGRVERPFVGVVSSTLTPPLAIRYGIDREQGELVLSVEPGSPAATAGLRTGDLLLAVGGVAIDEAHPFLNLLVAHAVGETVELRVLRRDSELLLNVTLESRED